MVGRVPWRVHRHPLALSETNGLGIGKRTLGLGVANQRRIIGRSTRYLMRTRRGGRGCLPPHGVLVAPRGARVGLRLAFEFFLADVGGIPPRAERRRRDDLRPRLLPHPSRCTEVVDVRVRDHDRVHVLQLEAGELEPLHQQLPRLRSGHARIDDGEALLVFEGVAIHVAEPWHPQRQLHAEDARGDLVDLGGRGLGLLSHRHPERLGVCHVRGPSEGLKTASR